MKKERKSMWGVWGTRRKKCDYCNRIRKTDVFTKLCSECAMELYED
ncbi:MAG: hypothetical protein DDT19_00765 [Syntrophomonadaceae bacterium]|nr:hypothetical protein [Bacillota bacterium]